MKAIVMTGCGGPEVLTIGEVAEPTCSSRDLLVRVRAAGLNRADILQRRGLYPAPAGVRQEIPGLEFAGEVVGAGSQVSRFGPGDRVMGILPGESQAQLVVVPEQLALPVPSGLSNEEAAALPEVFLTAWDALSARLSLREGESLLIHAVGSGVGTAALQLANLCGAIVFGTSRSDEKLRKAVRLGTLTAIHPESDDVLAVIMERTAGAGVQTILDLVGAPYWDLNLECLAQQGRMVLVGLTGGSRAQVDLSAIMRKRLRIIGTVLRSRGLEEKARLIGDFERRVLPHFQDGRLRAVVDRVFDWEDIAQAHAYMEDNRNFGKILIRINS